MDKLTSIRIKYNDGTYLDEVPIGVLAQNVGYDSGHNLIQVLGSVDVESNGTIQQQINKLFNEKLNSSDLSSYVNSKITTDVSTWLANNVNPVGSAVIVDQSLSISGAAADAKAAGDAVESTKLVDIGLFNIDSFLFSENEPEEIAFVRGVRGNSSGDSVAVIGNMYFSCTNLIPVTSDDIVTVINLMPDKYRFNVRGYTEDEEHDGIFVSGSATVLNPDLTSSGGSSTRYSNELSAVYKNTVEIIKPYNNIKYISVHARTFGAVKSTDADKEELNRCIKVIKQNLVLRDDFMPPVSSEKLPSIPLNKLPNIPSNKRTRLGSYAEIIGYSYINIDTVNKSMSVPTGFTVKCGEIKENNCAIDFSSLGSGHQTIYFDFDDKTIKITTYGAYRQLENVENTAYLGSVWASNTRYPKGYFTFNSPMEILVDGVKQLPHSSYFLNKTIALYGDSICYGRTTSSGTTTHLLQDIFKIQHGILATNYAIGGSCWAHRTGHSNDLSALVPTQTISTDFILFFAGTNDYGTNRPLGTIDDAPSGDEGNTFYAAMHYVLQYVLTQKPNIEIAMVTPTFRSYVSSGGSGDTYNTVRNSVGCTLGDYSDAMLEVAKLYNIPCLDMRRISPINKYNYRSMLEEQTEGGGLYLHPKDETYDILYNKICNWLITVL